MLSDDVKQILSEIFSGAGGIGDLQPKLPVMSASFDDTVALAELLTRILTAIGVSTTATMGRVTTRCCSRKLHDWRR